MFNIANRIRNGSGWEAIAEEIIKCEVRCSNCHRKITHERMNSRKQKLFDKYQKDVLE